MAEFISAIIAAGQHMVVICATIAVSTGLGLLAAAHQTDGREVVCILSGLDELNVSKKASSKSLCKLTVSNML